MKAKRPKANCYQSSIAGSCILNICVAPGEVSEAYGCDSITVLILGCSVTAGQADLNQNATDFGGRTQTVMSVKCKVALYCTGSQTGQYSMRNIGNFTMLTFFTR